MVATGGLVIGGDQEGNCFNFLHYFVDWGYRFSYWVVVVDGRARCHQYSFFNDNNFIIIILQYFEKRIIMSNFGLK